MTENKDLETTHATAGAGDGEQEFYEEPPRMSALDAVGVVVALLLLAAIGVAGYVWLTPGLSFDSLWPGGRGAAAEAMAPAAAEPAADQDTMAAGGGPVKCVQCGMFADKSASHVQATWSDGSMTDHDSWDCVFTYGAGQGLTLSGAQVVDYNSALAAADEPRWLDASTATYLYEAQSVPGSMPPYVAAFASEADAVQAQAGLGGTLVDFAGLAAQWDFDSYMFEAGQAPERMPAMEHEQQAEMEHPAPAHEHDPAEMADESAEAGPPAGHAGMPPAGEAPAADEARIDPLAAPQAHDHDMSCPYCGMPADASGSQVVVIWSSGDHQHYDSWDCLFNHGREEGLAIERAVVRLFGNMEHEPHWIKAQQAWYLYDVDRIAMSMPPYVAAFESAAAAEAAQPELGGELINFAELQAHWE